ncbi:DUF6152 family protein [Gammaproteobacteria bacterium]|nr:DUF6152 family protein [Gammaproteobacteria bacterium]
MKATINKVLTKLSGLLCVFMLITTAQAHHSFRAQYDSNKPVSLQGYVTKVEWYNPHVYIYLDVENPETGEFENWGVEMGPPHMLQNRGWKRNSMQIGDEIIVEATRARDGSTTANARSVQMAGTGQVMGAASSEQQTLTGGDAGLGGGN